MADKKKHYEPPPLGMLGMKLGQIYKSMTGKAQDIEKGGPKLMPMKKHPPDVKHGKSKTYHAGPTEPEKPGPVKITVYPYKDPKTGEVMPELVALKVPRGKVTAREFAARLKEIGLGLSAEHPRIITGNQAHIAIASKAETVAASKANPGTLIKPPEPPKPPPKWKSAGCVVIDSMDDLDHVYVRLPSNHYGPWTLPKGQVDKGESLKQAAVRETEEEIGLKVKILQGQGSYLGKFEGGFSWTHFFLAVKVAGFPHPTEETERVRLVTWEEAYDLLKHSKRDQIVIQRAQRALAQHFKK